MKTIYFARSKENGIFFYSNTIPDLTAEAFVNEKGEIHSRVTSYFEDTNSNEFKLQQILTKKQLVLVNILLIAILTLIFQSISITIAAIYFSLFCSKNFLYLIKLALLLKVGAMQSASRFHAAEHMAINSYCRLQRVPTLEEIKHFSRFNQSCGSMKMLRNMLPDLLISIGIACNTLLNIIVYIILIVICPFFVLFLDKVGLLKFFQIFFTSKPTDLELKVAIKGLNEFEYMEEKIQKGINGKCICFSFNMTNSNQE